MVLHQIRSILAFFTVLVAVAMQPAHAVQVDTTAMDRFLQRTVAVNHIPGLVVAIVSDKGVVYAKSHGKLQNGGPITPNTPFVLGSTSKMFTALAVLRLVRDGLVDLDAPVKRYIPEFAFAIPQAADGITVRHLLNQTSGIVDTCISASPLGAANLKDEAATVRSCVPASAPGKKYEYCNVNYRVLGYLVERVSGMPYGRFVKQHVFAPLGMRDSHPGPDGIANLAPGHTELFGMPIRHKQTYHPGALPSGYLVSSAADLARFLTEELNAAQGRGQVLDPELVKLTWTPALPKPPKGKISVQGYGMGWMAVTRNGRPLVAHMGSTENYMSLLIIDPTRKLGVVVLENQGSVMAMDTGFNDVREGILDMIDGKSPTASRISWPPLICLGIFLFVVAIEAFRTYRAARRLYRSPPGWGYRISTVFDAGVAVFVLFGLVPMMNALTDDNATWRLIYGFVPELFYILAVVILFSLIRVGVKIVVLQKARHGIHRW